MDSMKSKKKIAEPIGTSEKLTKNNETVHMKRQIGLIGGISMIVGSMIGSGIFISPVGVFINSGSSVALSLSVWLGCGILSTLCALTYIELGTVLPRSGGEHAYFMDAFKPLHKFWGELPAFLFAFMQATILIPSGHAILALIFAQYTILPILNALRVEKNWNKSTDYDLATKVIAVLCLTLVGFINITSAKISERVQIIFTFAKLSAAGLVILFGILNLLDGNFGSLPLDGFDKSEASYGSIALAFYSGLWSYYGWNSLNNLTEELVNPNRNLPLAVLIGLPLTAILYTFMNISYFTVLSKAEFVKSQAVGIEFGDKVLGSFSFIIPVLVAVSIFGSLNGAQYIDSRVLYAGARDGHLVDVLSYVQINRLTPSVAILFNMTLSILFVTFNGINELLDSFSLTTWTFKAITMVAFFVLRVTKPDIPRPFKVPLIVPGIALMITISLVVAPIINKPSSEYLSPLFFCLLGLIIYYPFVYKKTQVQFMEKVTVAVQKMAQVAPSPLKMD